MAQSSSASDPRTTASKLAREAESLLEAPGDTAVLARVAAGIEELGNRSLAARAFAALAASAREDGQFALAAFAGVALAHLGDERGGRAAQASLAAAYAAGSKRLDHKRRTRPPAPPPAKGGKEGEGAGSDDPQAAMKAASAAIDAAAAHAAELSKRATPLPAVPLVAALDAASLGELLGVMEPISKKAGEVIVEVGEEARSLYLVARGTLAVSRGAQELGRLGAGAFFGEIALLSGARRTARVAVVDDVWLLEIPHGGMEKAAAKAPALADVLARYARARLLANTMRTSEIFSRLEPAEREQLAPRFQPRVLAPGDKALTAGQEGDRLHVIVSGDVDVAQGERVLASLSAGDVFGEMSLLGRRPASADVVARTPTITLSLDRAGFDDIAVKRPELLAEVYKLLVAREAENRRADVHHEVTLDDIVV